MPDKSTDRNMLFGRLALQMDFIDREQLVAAMHAWVLEKDKPVGDIVIAAGALTHSDYELLTMIVERHVQLHDNDPAKSLQEISSLDSLREELKSIGDVEVEKTLDLMSASDSDPYVTLTYRVVKLTSGGERFRILRPHAKGGLGQVSVAHDNELNREVALKEIQNCHANDPNSRSRFLMEAEITGGLEHPGIVPVYGLGQYPDGRPFYAMRLLRGGSLKEAIDRFYNADKHGLAARERTLELRKLLGRFIDVCNAVEYAHNRGGLRASFLLRRPLASLTFLPLNQAIHQPVWL